MRNLQLRDYISLAAFKIISALFVLQLVFFMLSICFIMFPVSLLKFSLRPSILSLSSVSLLITSVQNSALVDSLHPFLFILECVEEKIIEKISLLQNCSLASISFPCENFQTKYFFFLKFYPDLAFGTRFFVFSFWLPPYVYFYVLGTSAMSSSLG